MQRIVKDGAIVDDGWLLLRADEDGQLPAAPAGRDVIVPLAAWLAERAAWQAHAGRVGVWLAPEEEWATLLDDLAALPLLAIDFPAFTDGRGYSAARLLRERHGYRGELRAVGDVWQDVLHYLWQVGFDSFAIKGGKGVESSVFAYHTFSDRYQSSWREPQPLFRRRVIGL